VKGEPYLGMIPTKSSVRLTKAVKRNYGGCFGPTSYQRIVDQDPLSLVIAVERTAGDLQGQIERGPKK